MSARRTGPSRRTQAERDAINARAAAWERPLNVGQRITLSIVASARGDYRPPRPNPSLGVLHRRGLIVHGKTGGSWRITSKGRKELAHA